MVAPGALLPGGIPNGMRRGGKSTLTGLAAGLTERADPFRTSFEDWVGAEEGNRSIQEYNEQSTGGASYTLNAVAPDSGDTETIGLLEVELSADPAAQKGVLRRQDSPIIAVDGLEATFWAHRFRMQSLEPDGGNYAINAGGLATLASTTTENYNDGVFLYYDRTLGVESWVVRCARGGASADIDLGIGWDNSFHTIGFLHYGDRVFGFADGSLIATAETGATIQPSTTLTAIAFHIVAAAAGTDDGKIQSDWVWWGRFNEG